MTSQLPVLNTDLLHCNSFDGAGRRYQLPPHSAIGGYIEGGGAVWKNLALTAKTSSPEWSVELRISGGRLDNCEITVERGSTLKLLTRGTRFANVTLIGQFDGNLAAGDDPAALVYEYDERSDYAVDVTKAYGISLTGIPAERVKFDSSVVVTGGVPVLRGLKVNANQIRRHWDAIVATDAYDQHAQELAAIVQGRAATEEVVLIPSSPTDGSLLQLAQTIGAEVGPALPDSYGR